MIRLTKSMHHAQVKQHSDPFSEDDTTQKHQANLRQSRRHRRLEEERQQ